MSETQELPRAFKGIWIPREWFAKFGISFVGRIIDCFLGTGSLSEQEWKILKAESLAEETFADVSQIESFLRLKIPIKIEIPLGIRKFICDWCQSQTFCPHDHHYPVPKFKGGTETISICPNCHSEFHFLEKSHSFTQKFVSIVRGQDVYC